MIDKGAANQRSGVLGSLNMVADAFKLLPKAIETTRPTQTSWTGRFPKTSGTERWTSGGWKSSNSRWRYRGLGTSNPAAGR